MLLSYFRIAFRNLRRNKGYSFINIFGLATGLAITLLIGLWITDELSFDHYYANHRRIAQVMAHHPGSYTGSSISPALKTAVQTGYEDVFKKTAIASAPYKHLVTSDNKKIFRQAIWTQPTFPEIFTFQMLAGATKSLQDPSTALISAETAKALFGVSNPLGKIIRIDDTFTFTIGGVYADLPFNTTFHEIQVLLPWDNKNIAWQNTNTSDWTDHNARFYAELADKATFDQATARIRDLPTPFIKNVHEELLTYPFDWLHLHDEFKGGVPSGGRIQFVWLFGTIGAFVLLLACINFMNLATARSEKRAKEVTIRKTIGSRRHQLIAQFLGESILVALLAFLAAIALASASLPFFNELAAKEITFPWTNARFWLSALSFTIFTGIIAGSYPAFYLSSFQPARAIRRRTGLPRKILVVTQFTVSLSLVIATIVVFRQIEFAKDRPIGYNREGLITIPKKTPALYGHYEPLRNSILHTGVVENIAESSQPTTIFDNNNAVHWTGQTAGQDIYFWNVNVTRDFGKTVGWTILQGRDFSRDYPTDSNAMLLNEEALKQTGFKDPIGRHMTFNQKDYTIIGIVKNMLTNSPYENIHPAIFLGDGNTHYITIRIKPNTPIRTALAALEAVFKQFDPASPFVYSFNDDDFARKFAAESRIGNLAMVFSGLAILISCLGLFGLASFVAEQRTKEIGVRKVLGAGILDLWALLSGDFVRLVLISMFIAMPLIALAMNHWLRNYTLHTNLSPWIFIFAGAGILLLTILTVSFQALKAAFMNPVRSLRSE